VIYSPTLEILKLEFFGLEPEFAFTTRSKSGLTNLKAHVTFDKVGTSIQHALKLKLKHRF
jgi:hypothetical protein